MTPEQQIREALKSGVRLRPIDCTGDCDDAACNCSGIWLLDSEACKGLAALDTLVAQHAEQVRRLEKERDEAVRDPLAVVRAAIHSETMSLVRERDALARQVEQLQTENERLRGALGEDASGRPLTDLLRDARMILEDRGGGPLADCLGRKADQIDAAAPSEPAGIVVEHAREVIDAARQACNDGHHCTGHDACAVCDLRATICQVMSGMAVPHACERSLAARTPAEAVTEAGYQAWLRARGILRPAEAGDAKEETA